jgi:hypothetical protein
MGPVETVITYTSAILYLLFKFVVIYHAAKNQKGYFWVLVVILPIVDFYYYYKYVKVN